MVKYLKGRNIIVNDLEGGVNLDSDCEDYSMGTAGRKPKKGKEEEIRAVLITGSFAACVRFLAHPHTTSRRMTSFQLEIPFLLSLHRCNLVRSPQIAR